MQGCGKVQFKPRFFSRVSFGDHENGDHQLEKFTFNLNCGHHKN